jgi:hypothetical protein
MTAESKHISVLIDRPAREVYAYAAEPDNLVEWAPGLGSAMIFENGQWYVETTEGRVGISFVERNDLGVLDHWVTTTLGEVVYIPLRVFANEDGSEVVFSLRRNPGMSDEEFERDAGLVASDLARLKRVLEHRSTPRADGPSGG